MDALKRLLKPVFRGLYQPLMRMTRGMTLGVRCAVVNEKGEVLLIRHSYAPGWALPGGGVEQSETLLDALKKELREEAGIVLNSPPTLHGIFANFEQFPGDHVAIYVARDWELPNGFKRSLEIIDHGFFAPDRLPDSVTKGTKRRIDEIFNDAPVSANW